MSGIELRWAVVRSVEGSRQMIKVAIIIGVGGLFAAATVAEAARCPSGQIYRVSKKTCMSKARAIKMGIKIKSRWGNRSRAAAKSEQSPPTAGRNTGVPSARGAVDKAMAGEAVGTTPAGKRVPGSRPEISPIPIRMVKPVYIRPTPGPELAPGLTAKPNAAPASPPSLLATPIKAAPTLEPKKPKFRPIPIVSPSASALASPGASSAAQRPALQNLKDKLQDHVEKNRGKLTKRAMPGG